MYAGKSAEGIAGEMKVSQFSITNRDSGSYNVVI